MPGYIVDVESSDGTNSQWMCKHPNITKAIEEVFQSCRNYKIVSIKLLREKGKQDG
jgi:hypothetical protein